MKSIKEKASITDFDFANDELRPFEFKVVEIELALLRRLGLVSDRFGFIPPADQ